jgi:hypothetical protein
VCRVKCYAERIVTADGKPRQTLAVVSRTLLSQSGVVEKSPSSHARAANFTKHVQELASCKITRIAIVGRAGYVDNITISDMELNLLETRVLVQDTPSIRHGIEWPYFVRQWRRPWPK